MNHTQVEITGADIAAFMSHLAALDIALYDVIWKDSLSFIASISSKQKKALLRSADKYGVSVKIIKTNHILKTLNRIGKRPVLVLGVLSVICFSLFLPTRVLQIEIEGNKTVTDRYILEAAEQCGITFGADRSKVRSEVIKNRLLELLPQLQWAGINTYGCRAVISVTEKALPQKENDTFQVSSLVASSDGIIESVTAIKGNLLCTVGQAVTKGQVLISGYLDCGNKIQASRAEGEVYAHTQHTVNALLPLDYTQKNHLSRDIKKYSIIFGKNRINLSKDSGISTTGYDKIYTEYTLVLPGGLVLPLTLAVEHRKGYNNTQDSLSANVTIPDLNKIANIYLLQQMISGKIIKKTENITYTKNAICLNGVYNCLEMIGRIRVEEIIDGKDH